MYKTLSKTSKLLNIDNKGMYTLLSKEIKQNEPTKDKSLPRIELSRTNMQTKPMLSTKSNNQAEFISIQPFTAIFQPFIRALPAFRNDLVKTEALFKEEDSNLGSKYRFRDEKRNEFPNSQMKRLVYECFGEGSYDSEEKIEISNPNMYSLIGAGKNAPMEFSNSFSQYVTALPYYYKLLDVNDITLQFESRFENGNLRRAIQISEFEYDLFLKTDFRTSGFTQWFFFKILNTKPGKVSQ